MNSVDHSLRDRWAESIERRRKRGKGDGEPPGRPREDPPGAPPGGPDLPTRVAALEAGMKDVKGNLNQLLVSSARIEAALARVATDADLAKVEGKIDTIDAKVGALDARVGRVETNVGTALATAVGKAIGPIQFVGILAASGTILGALAVVYGWVSRQPWFLK